MNMYLPFNMLANYINRFPIRTNSSEKNGLIKKQCLDVLEKKNNFDSFLTHHIEK